MKHIAQNIAQLSTAPKEEKAFQQWLSMKDALSFLTDNLAASDTVIYASSQFLFVHAVIVPINDFKTNPKRLLQWDFNACGSWSVSRTMSEPVEVEVFSPFADQRNEVYKNAEKIVFCRAFEGRIGEHSYFEANQKFLHLSELHFIAERNAYCRLDKRGDVESVIQMERFKKSGSTPEHTVVTCNAEVLARYAALNDCAIVRTFDFTRYGPKNFNGYGEAVSANDVDESGLKYHLHIGKNETSYMRGVQIIIPNISKAEAAAFADDRATEEKQYASFIAYDWRHEKVVEISCEPSKTANYFQKSDLPFELSPAFFRPEVLSKYKTDSDKYKLGDRTVSCRGTWYLKSIDINEAGQVHAYICDLRDLPYEEQLHWKSHNERPKGSISKRAFTNDFKGDWSNEYDPLLTLKHSLMDWREKGVPWWKLRAENLFDITHYPVTDSADEWGNELLNLDQLVVEGFEEKWFRKLAEKLQRNPDEKWKSLKLMEECLIGAGRELEETKQLMSGLNEVHSLRSKVKGHASHNGKQVIRQEVVKKHKSTIAHFRSLCSEIEKAIIELSSVFDPYIEMK